MRKPGGSTHRLRCVADAAAASLLTELTTARRTENIACAALVHRVQQIVELRFETEMSIHELGEEADATFARRTVECEAAVALSLTRTAVRDLITVGEQLSGRLPSIEAAFNAGALDYPRVRTIALILAKASDDTACAIEDDVLAAALRCNPKALRERTWALWTSHNPAEAAAARVKAQAEERCASITRGDDGMSTLYARMTTLEATECDALLDEVAATVCPRDPRTKKQLRGHALIALLHREDSLTCRCGTGTCPMIAANEHRSSRRTPLVQIMIDIETLLGLDNQPATLADGTVLDADIARTLATDARWQMLLVEMRNAAQEYMKERTNAPEADAGVDERSGEGPDRGNSEDEQSDDHESRDGSSSDGCSSDGGPSEGGLGNDGSSDGGEPGVGDPTPPPTCAGSAPTPRARRFIGRGRIRPAAALPSPPSPSLSPLPPPSPSPPPSPPSPPTRPGVKTLIGRERAISDAVASFLRAIDADPSLGRGLYPDGHGGHLVPPRGALTYRPSAELVALTRATHQTCTFPGCGVPAARCEIDHIVPFDRLDPAAGGWSVATNLQPLCHYHHQAKTSKIWAAVKLSGDSIYWTSASGLRHITPAAYGTVTITDTFTHNRAPTSSRPILRAKPDPDPPSKPEPPSTSEPSEAIYEPTWWETQFDEHDSTWGRRHPQAPTLADIAALGDPRAREDATYLRNRYLEHRAVLAARLRFQPPPF